MKSNVKFFVLGFVFCLMVGGVAIGISQVSEVYYSQFPIEVNGESYTPEMPVLNYMGRTYLALREFATVTGNIVDFKYGTIILQDNEFEKEEKLNFTNGTKSLRLEYEAELKDENDPYDLNMKQKMYLDNVLIYEYNFDTYNGYGNETDIYIIKDKIDKNKEYAVLKVEGYYPEIYTYNRYYIIGEDGKVYKNMLDETHDGSQAVFADIEYEHAQGLNIMFPEILSDAFRICVQEEGIWKRIEYTFENGELKNKIIQEFDPSVINYAGAT